MYIHLALMLRCQCPSVCLSVCLSVTEVHWRIIANLSFKFRSKFTAHCGHGACLEEGRDHRREEWRDHLALCQPLLGPLVTFTMCVMTCVCQVYNRLYYDYNDDKT